MTMIVNFLLDSGVESGLYNIVFGEHNTVRGISRYDDPRRTLSYKRFVGVPFKTYTSHSILTCWYVILEHGVVEVIANSASSKQLIGWKFRNKHQINMFKSLTKL